MGPLRYGPRQAEIIKADLPLLARSRSCAAQAHRAEGAAALRLPAKPKDLVIDCDLQRVAIKFHLQAVPALLASQAVLSSGRARYFRDIIARPRIKLHPHRWPSRAALEFCGELPGETGCRWEIMETNAGATRIRDPRHRQLGLSRAREAEAMPAGIVLRGRADRRTGQSPRFHILFEIVHKDGNKTRCMPHRSHGSARNGQDVSPCGTELDLVRADANELSCQMLPAVEQDAKWCRRAEGGQWNWREADMVDLTERHGPLLAAGAED